MSQILPKPGSDRLAKAWQCAIVLALLTFPLQAQWKQNGTVIPDEPFRKSAGTFGVMLLLTDQPEQFMEEWKKKDVPQMETTDVAVRGKPIVAFLFFVGCKEVGGVCNSTVDVTVLRPDGSEYASHKGGELWKGKPAPRDVVQLSASNLAITIEPNDPPGRYLVKAAAHDVNAFRSLTVEQSFTVK